MSAPNQLHQLSESERIIIAKSKSNNDPTLIDFALLPSQAKNGYLGVYFKVEMTIKEKGKQPEKHSFFMKAQPLQGWSLKFLEEEGGFQKEVNFYKDLSALLRKYISVDVYPQCFLAVPGKIVLEDALLQGYSPLKDLRQPFDYNHSKAVLIALARLHVASIIYEEKTGRKVNEDFPDTAREVTYRTDGGLGRVFLRCSGEALTALAPHLDSNLGKDPEAVALLQAQIGPWMNKLANYLNEDSPYRKVICHGDAWPANFLFKYDETQNPLSAWLVDFQMTRHRSPAVDICAFLYISIPVDDLKKWRENLLDTYYEVMVDEMRINGLDADQVYSREEFLQAYVYNQLVGVIYALHFYQFARVDPDALAEIAADSDRAWKFYYEDRTQEVIQFYKNCPLLRRYMNGALEEMYENFIKTRRGLTEMIP